VNREETELSVQVLVVSSDVEFGRYSHAKRRFAIAVAENIILDCEVSRNESSRIFVVTDTREPT
jgi:hypothetical protein